MTRLILTKEELLKEVEGLPDEMKVAVEPDIEITASTVGELRSIPSCPVGLVVTVPREWYPESEVLISRSQGGMPIEPKRVRVRKG